jgi:Tfp pilus assembly PilM family ATPase
MGKSHLLEISQQLILYFVMYERFFGFERITEMWTVIYMAKPKKLIEKIHNTLTDAGLEVQVHPVGQEGNEGYFEILVPETEAQIAHMELIRIGF